MPPFTITIKRCGPSNFVDELECVRRCLGLERLHLFGNSWGGMPTMEYALTQPRGLASIVIESSPASTPGWVSEANRSRAQLPDVV